MATRSDPVAPRQTDVAKAGVQAGMRCCINKTVSISSDPFELLREANTNGGYNDLSSCGLCDEKTKETRHGEAEKARWRP